jgi:two-component system, OmpR family, response regulator
MPMARILVVDDEPRIQSFLTRALVGERHEIETTGDGLSAVRLATDRHYDLVLLDLALPGMDGVSVLRSLREAGEDAPIVVMSALCDVRAKVECLDLGAVDYVTKPFALAELIARINARLREPAGPRAGRIRVGRMIIDRPARRVEFAGESLSLTSREFHLLEHLARNAGRTCDRSELLAAAWESGETGSNVVDACVRRLRSKVGSETIETVRNEGYRLVAA